MNNLIVLSDSFSPLNCFLSSSPLGDSPPTFSTSLQVPDVTVTDAQKNYKKSLEKGILKILSKMGISLLQCYHGAQVWDEWLNGRDFVKAPLDDSRAHVQLAFWICHHFAFFSTCRTQP